MYAQPLKRARGSLHKASCSPICCKQTSKALVRLSGCAGSPELSLFACAVSTIFYLLSHLFSTGLESVTHYPVLAVVAGALSQLLMKTDEEL